MRSLGRGRFWYIYTAGVHRVGSGRKERESRALWEAEGACRKEVVGGRISAALRQRGVVLLR